MYLKYRPKTLDEVLGNKAVKKALSDLEPDRPVMFEGQRGCGKTSLAYIVCGMQDIPEESVKVVDCIVIKGIDDMRDIIDELGQSSLFSNKRALILDEVHGLSAKARQSLLTTLEKEKILDKVLVIACTTEIKDLPDTFLDRFKRFKVQPLSNTDSKKLLNDVSSKEGIKLEKEIEELLLKQTEGNPRRILNGLSILKNITDLEEAKYLLYLDDAEESKDVLYLLKLFVKEVPWEIIKDKLNTLYKSYTPSAIRVGMMNLISARLLYGYPTGDRVIQLYKYLREYDKYPEKAELTLALYQWLNK